MYSGKLWPCHPKPKDDELISSWLVRLAWAHGITPHELCQITWPYEKITGTDVDQFHSDSFITTLAEKTGVDIPRVQQTTLKAYEGVIFEESNPLGLTPWVIPIASGRHSPNLYGIPFCSICLAEDEIPYFRRKWRLAYVAVCDRHRIMLADHCPHCKKPVNIKWDQEVFVSHADCPACGDDLTTSKPPELEDIDRHLAWQQRLDKVVSQGWIELDGRFIDSILFFMGLRQIMFVLARGTKVDILRTALTRRIKAPIYLEHHYQNLKGIEMLSVSNRLSLLAPLGWLFDDWPARFSELCRSKRVGPSILLRDMAYVPSWYDTAVQNLFSSRSFPTQEETECAIHFLQTNGYQVSEPNLEQLLGHRLRNIINFGKYPPQEFRTEYPEGNTKLGRYAIQRAIRIFGDEEMAMRWLKTPTSTFNLRRPIDLLVYLQGALDVLQELYRIQIMGKKQSYQMLIGLRRG